MAITPARTQQGDFSDPVYSAPTEVVVVPANDTTAYQVLADLKIFPLSRLPNACHLQSSIVAVWAYIMGFYAHDFTGVQEPET